MYSSFKIGSSNTCDIRIQKNDISNIHCLINFNFNEFRLRDEKSDSGTFYMLNPNQEFELEINQIYQIGNSLIQIENITNFNLILKIISGPLKDEYEKETIVIKNNEIIIGSVEKCNYNCKDPTLSKIHAIFKKNDKEKYVIIDNESTNG